MWAIMWADITSSSSCCIHRHVQQITGHRERTTAKQNRKEVGRKLLYWSDREKNQWWPQWSDVQPFQRKWHIRETQSSCHTGSTVCVQPDSAGLIQLFVCTNTSSSSNNIIGWGRITGLIRLSLSTGTIWRIVACLWWNVKCKAVRAGPGGWFWWAEWPTRNNGDTVMNWGWKKATDQYLLQLLSPSYLVWILRGGRCFCKWEEISKCLMEMHILRFRLFPSVSIHIFLTSISHC